MTLAMIIATDMNYGIGYNGRLPWDIPQDRRFFAGVTKDSCVVMGRRTAKYLPGPLEYRANYVLSHERSFHEEYNKRGFICKYDAGFVKRDSLPMRLVFIIGGAEVYKQFYNDVSVIIHTQILSEYKCDTYLDSISFDDKLNKCYCEVSYSTYIQENIQIVYNCYVQKEYKDLPITRQYVGRFFRGLSYIF